ncbi:MAG: hypothetical protein KF802_03335 [Bdellovibrionaceae bacterium]|nr:hypothetical protein [Pseudobdellovibrionaceae bacterium]
MSKLPALREAPALSPFQKGDVLVLFGELFSRGYANGLVEEAERLGMTIVRATVGRREKDGVLRPLTAEEAATIPAPFINVPLEAGFDLEPNSQGLSPVELMKDVKLSDWEGFQFPAGALEESRERGIERFRRNTAEFMRQLRPLIPAGANVLFAHLMAGGVPRTKVVMPLLNRVVKGTGDRYLPSQKLWDSSIGRFCAMNFREVTAETLRHLLVESTPLRQEIEGRGRHVSYLAYGYHGTEILLQGDYRWQTYTPYVQGWAKMDLENIAREFHREGRHVAVYNCPEILTNSSSIFQGVELSLYPLIDAFDKEDASSPVTAKIKRACAELLVDGEATFERIRGIISSYYANPEIRAHCLFERWPQHTSREQLETMLAASQDLQDLHKDPKQLITAVLSESVFEACGRLMLHDSWTANEPVRWIGHDGVTRALLA